MSSQVMYLRGAKRIIPVGIHYVNPQTGELVDAQGNVVLPSTNAYFVARSLRERVGIFRLMMRKARQTQRSDRPALIAIFWNLLVLASNPKGMRYRLFEWKPKESK